MLNYSKSLNIAPSSGREDTPAVRVRPDAPSGGATDAATGGGGRGVSGEAGQEGHGASECWGGKELDEIIENK